MRDPVSFHYTRATSRLLYLGAIKSVRYTEKLSGFCQCFVWNEKLGTANNVAQEGLKETVYGLFGLHVARLLAISCGGL